MKIHLLTVSLMLAAAALPVQVMEERCRIARECLEENDWQ